MERATRSHACFQSKETAVAAAIEGPKTYWNKSAYSVFSLFLAGTALQISSVGLCSLSLAHSLSLLAGLRRSISIGNPFLWICVSVWVFSEKLRLEAIANSTDPRNFWKLPPETRRGDGFLQK